MMTTSQEYERRRWIALALLCFAQFIVVLDASIINVALPSIGTGLNFSQENLAWVVNAYVLTFGGFLLLGGRMADLLDTDVEPELGELLAGSGKDALPVAPRVCALGHLFRRSGWGGSFRSGCRHCLAVL
jgi:MFS family permease